MRTEEEAAEVQAESVELCGTDELPWKNGTCDANFQLWLWHW